MIKANNSASTLRRCMRYLSLARLHRHHNIMTARWIILLTVALLAWPRPAAADPERARIVIYNGFGTTARACLGGRVLEDKAYGKAKKNESWYRKMRRNISALESDEIPNVKLEIQVLGKKHMVKSDSEGLFKLDLPGPLKVGDHLITARLKGKLPFRTEAGRLLIWPKKPGVVVISDIDDTVLDTKVTSKLKMLKGVLLKNARDLNTFKGAPSLFRVWAGRGYPIVFVSGSPINLYSRLQHFLSLTRFPAAPLMLKELGKDKLTEQKGYKLRQIKKVLDLLPGYQLIMVGDSGEKDPEVYTAVARKHPKRVMVTAIHRVTPEPHGAARFAGQVLFSSYRKLSKTLVNKGLLTPAEYKLVKKRK